MTSRNELSRNIKKVAQKVGAKPSTLTRYGYLLTARNLNLDVVRSKGTIQLLGGWKVARRNVKRV